MNNNSEQFFEKLMNFSQASIKWCVEESEKSVSKIGEIISFLISDSERITTMSTETLQALINLKKELNQLSGQTANTGDVTKIKEVLQSVQKSHEDTRMFLEPVIESLQFHDRIRQRMENILKMMHYWQKHHQEFARKHTLGESDLLAIGAELAKLTTMTAERDLIRRLIPNLAAEQAPQDDVMFF